MDGRWPLADLVAYCVARRHLTLSQVRHKIMRVNAETWARYAADGFARPLDDYEADRLAVRAGTHPGLVWSEWFEDVPPEQLELFDLFVPSRSIA